MVRSLHNYLTIIGTAAEAVKQIAALRWIIIYLLLSMTYIATVAPVPWARLQALHMIVLLMKHLS